MVVSITHSPSAWVRLSCLVLRCVHRLRSGSAGAVRGWVEPSRSDPGGRGRRGDRCGAAAPLRNRTAGKQRLTLTRFPPHQEVQCPKSGLKLEANVFQIVIWWIKFIAGLLLIQQGVFFFFYHLTWSQLLFPSCSMWRSGLLLFCSLRPSWSSSVCWWALWWSWLWSWSGPRCKLVMRVSRSAGNKQQSNKILKDLKKKSLNWWFINSSLRDKKQPQRCDEQDRSLPPTVKFSEPRWLRM